MRAAMNLGRVDSGQGAGAGARIDEETLAKKLWRRNPYKKILSSENEGRIFFSI